MPSHKHGVADTNNTDRVYTRLDVNKTDKTVYKTLVTGTSGYYQYKDPARPELFRLSDSYVGEGEPHNNIPPYLGVYMWKRVA